MAYSSGGFRPTMLENLLADSQASFRSKRIGAIRRQDAAEEARLARRDEAVDFADQRMAENQAAKAEAQRIAPIEGEPGEDYHIRLANQRMQPNMFGSKYREALKKADMDGSVSAAPSEQASMDADRLRRKRMMMAGMPAYE